MFTEEQQEQYRNSAGCDCPSCGENDLIAGHFDCDGFSAWRRVQCLNPDCRIIWTEVYNFSYIE